MARPAPYPASRSCPNSELQRRENGPPGALPCLGVPAEARRQGEVREASECLPQLLEARASSNCTQRPRSEGLMLSPSWSVPGAFLLENTPVVGSSKSRQII